MQLEELIEQYCRGRDLIREVVLGMRHEQILARPVAEKWSTLGL